jgi:hypothetical protein
MKKKLQVARTASTNVDPATGGNIQTNVQSQPRVQAQFGSPSTFVLNSSICALYE